MLRMDSKKILLLIVLTTLAMTFFIYSINVFALSVPNISESSVKVGQSFTVSGVPGDVTSGDDVIIGDDATLASATPAITISDSDVEVVADADSSGIVLSVLTGEPLLSLSTSTGVLAKFEFFADTLCAILGTDTLRVVPSR